MLIQGVFLNSFENYHVSIFSITPNLIQMKKHRFTRLKLDETHLKTEILFYLSLNHVIGSTN